MAALLTMPEFVAPPPYDLDVDSFMQKHGMRLSEYEARYARHGSKLSFWRDWINPSDVLRFRSEVFVSQAAAHHSGVFGPIALRDAYYLEWLYANSVDELGALELFEDDGAFGGLRFDIGKRLVSRAILDSVIELNFVAKHCGLSRSTPFTLIDIGAGSGRLVRRAMTLFDEVSAYALDAVPFSSFICEYYLGFRGLADHVTIGGPETLSEILGLHPRIATNIHSWTESPAASIESWLDGLVTADVDWLLLVTHSADPVSAEIDSQTGLIIPGRQIVDMAEARGFRVEKSIPKYGACEALAKHGFYGFTHYHLFSR